MEKVGDKARWLWSLFPIRIDGALPNFEIHIKRLTDNTWLADVKCVGTELIRPFNLVLFGRYDDVEFNAESWIEKQQSEISLKVRNGSEAKYPLPSGRNLEDVVWIAIASSRRPAVGTFGWFKGLLIFSHKRPQVGWLLRRMFVEFWRTGLAVIGWLAIVGMILSYLFLSQHTPSPPSIIHKI